MTTGRTRTAEHEVIAEGLRFPEGPVALPDGSILVVEVAGGTLCRISRSREKCVVAELGGGPNGAAIGPDGRCYVCNNGGTKWIEQGELLIPGDASTDYRGGRIEVVDLVSGSSEVLYTHCGDVSLKGPNDLIFDSSGGFWFTDTGKTHGRSMDLSAVYYAIAGGERIEERLFPFDRTNGIALSADEDRIYFSETLTGRIWAFDLEGPGRLAEEFKGFASENVLYGAPGFTGFDSMALEANGNICQATLFNGGVTVISPQGELVEFVEFSDPFVTNICFGGADMRTAFVTLAGSGELVKTRWPRPGLPLNYSRLPAEVL